MAERRGPADLDPQMRAFLAATTDTATKGVDIFTAPLPQLRQAVEAGRSESLSGGPAMARTEEFWVRGHGRYILCRANSSAERRPAPVLVWLHGGGWTWNSIYTADRTAREFASRTGVTVVSVDYSLSPEYKFPQALNECVEVVRWVAREGLGRDLDPDNILVGGDSAGANLALGTALALRDANEPVLKGVVLFYGVYDADFARESYRLYGGGDYPLSERNMRLYWANYTGSPDQRMHPHAAPFRADVAGLPPVWLGAAEVDVLADENAAMAAKLQAAGIDTSYRCYPGLTHGFLRAVDAVSASASALQDSSDWIRTRLAR